MKNIWHIRFKIRDRTIIKGNKKRVLSNINLDVPTDLLPYVWRLIYSEVQRLAKDAILH
jgi:hypothetical protein